jgi:hypothetical protein
LALLEPDYIMQSETQSEFPYVSRVCFLGGGLTALNNPGTKVEVTAGVPGPILFEFEIIAFGSLFARLSQLGTLVIGCQFNQDPEELQALRPAVFRVFAVERGWLASDASTLWRQVAANSMQHDQMQIADGAARVAFELQAVEHRISQLCNAYSTQLRALVVKKEIEEYKRFDDLNSSAVVHCVHALFYELAVLRDYLAEFISRHVLSIYGPSKTPICTMDGLRKRLKAEPVNDPLARDLIAITDQEKSEPGWLATLSAYRNLFTHVAPLQQATHRDFAVQEELHLQDGAKLPALYRPLPANAILLARTRSKGFPFDRFVDWAKASAAHRPNRTEQPDALEFLHAAVNRMADLSMRVVARSPVEPKPIELGPDDLVGPITIHRG